MKKITIRLIYLVLGQVLFALGIVLSVRANIGYAPWEVFHIGIGNTIGLTLGVVSIIAGAVLLVFVTVMGEKIGVGSILGFVLTGAFIDVILYIDVIPLATTFFAGTLLLIAGMFVMSLATYVHIITAFGAGPRDNLMIVAKRKTGFPIGVCRSAVEGLATLIGWLLGGMVGYGTIISAVGIGFCVQITFRVLRFDPTKIKHETLVDTFRSLMRRG